ncbi:S24 family peptidase [Sphingobium yanoikuyae]|uniref:XRE family transcriptional regulator n=2 Tax=Sphingobium yanoikuyae TaxID=13690 RepID=UPI0028AEFB14|nr:S24 family peptidase [Sphingobium yanoikuyae]
MKGSLQHHIGVETVKMSTPNWRVGQGHHFGAEEAMALVNNIGMLREARGWARPELAKRMGTSTQQVERLEKGQRGLKPEWIERAARALGVPPADIITPLDGGLHLGVEPDLPVVQQAGDGSIALRRINIGFAMGDGSNLDDYIEEGTIDFDASLLRLISPSPAHRLVVADGVGDSMQPTLMDSDMIVIDTMQNQLNKWDRIWALSLQGAGAVKRLGPSERGKVEIISDNPAIPNRIVPLEDVRIIGRVVWSGRRH